MTARNLYLVKRPEDRGRHYHPSLTFHPVIVCRLKAVAEWEADWSGHRAWVWVNPDVRHRCGWLLIRWEGLVIDYGHLVRGFDLPDGTPAGFHHPHGRPETWALLKRAKWWSTSPLPDWLAADGVTLCEDKFSLERIADAERAARQRVA